MKKSKCHNCEHSFSLWNAWCNIGTNLNVKRNLLCISFKYHHSCELKPGTQPQTISDKGTPGGDVLFSKAIRLWKRVANLRISCVPVYEFFCGYLSFSLSFFAGLLVSAATNDASLSISFSTGDTKLDSNTPCVLKKVLYHDLIEFLVYLWPDL